MRAAGARQHSEPVSPEASAPPEHPPAHESWLRLGKPPLPADAGFRQPPERRLPLRMRAGAPAAADWPFPGALRAPLLRHLRTWAPIPGFQKVLCSRSRNRQACERCRRRREVPSRTNSQRGLGEMETPLRFPRDMNLRSGQEAMGKATQVQENDGARKAAPELAVRACAPPADSPSTGSAESPLYG